MTEDTGSVREAGESESDGSESGERESETAEREDVEQLAAVVDDGEHFVYVLRCADDSLYTGYTTDVERRVRQHDRGDGAKYTRGRTPVELVHVEAFDSQSAAMGREYAVKQLDRREKERLVDAGGPVED